MSDQFEVIAVVREDMGKGSSRRLRRADGQIPAIIYGGDKDPQPLTIICKDLEKSLENESFYSHVLSINVAGKKEKAILKDLQRHPARNSVIHADFLRIDDKVAIKVNVQFHFINEDISIGVKQDGGMVQHQVTEMEILCLPADIPEFLAVDMQAVEVGQIVHLSDVVLPEGVISVALALGEDHDLAIASIVAPKVASDGEDEVVADADGEEEEEGDGGE
ncbi:MAG: large subunit ribosomal protein L25 [Halioglobus sp.]|jgi:large subunit ribosomal protein L25